MATASAIITEIDQDIERQLGPSTHAQLRATLDDLATITTRNAAPSSDGSHESKPPRSSR
jgi:hypothetical protein